MTAIARDSRATDAPTSTQVRIVALLFGLSAASYFCRVAISIAAPSIMKEYHVSEPRMGVVFVASLWSYTLLQAPGGWLADKFGSRIVLVVAGLGAALCTALTALAGIPGFGAIIGVLPAFLLIRIAFGACTAPLYPSCGRIIAAWIPPARQARALGAIVAAAGVGAALSPVVYSPIIAARGWRICFLIAAVAALLALGLFQAFLPRQGADHGTTSRSDRRGWRAFAALLRNRNLLLITGSYLALNYFEFIFYYWIYYYFDQIRKFGPANAAVATTASFVSMAIGPPIGGFLTDQAVTRWGIRNGKRVVPIAGMILSATLLYVGVAGWGVAMTIILFSLAVGCSMATEGAFWSSALAVAGRNAGAATGIYNCGGNLGGVLGPLITPLIAARFGWTVGLYFMSAVMLVGMVAWFFIDPSPIGNDEPIPAR